jgi:hypothetical protein
LAWRSADETSDWVQRASGHIDAQPPNHLSRFTGGDGPDARRSFEALEHAVVTLIERIDLALDGEPMAYADLARKLYPDARSHRYQVNGGPPGC